MKEKFIKGDWQVALIDNRSRILIESENTGYCIADIQDVSDTDKANAALIAAAPEMYEMLQSQSRMMHKMGFTHKRDAIDLLLSKARGEL